MAWHVVNVAGPGAANPFYCEFMIDAETDITAEPVWKTFIGYKPAIGSVAYTCTNTAALEKLWMRNANEGWSPIG